jgi:ribosomal protein S18 acetylase RimI-like enzyme
MEGARTAAPADVPRLAELCRQALSELAPTRGGAVFVARDARAEPVEASLRRALFEPDCRVLAGTLDGQIVGYAVGRTDDLRDGSRLGLIEDLYVEEEARGVGVGEALMNGMLDWFRERECAGVDALALPGNRAAKNFFEGAGFSARLIVMHHRMAVVGGQGQGSGEEAVP